MQGYRDELALADLRRRNGELVDQLRATAADAEELGADVAEARELLEMPQRYSQYSGLERVLHAAFALRAVASGDEQAVLGAIDEVCVAVCAVEGYYAEWQAAKAAAAEVARKRAAK